MIFLTLINFLGIHWTKTSAGKGNWFAVTSTSTGSFLSVCQKNGGIYISADGNVSTIYKFNIKIIYFIIINLGGTKWSKTTAPDLNWNTIASDSKGTNLFAGVNNGYIYKYSNG